MNPDNNEVRRETTIVTIESIPKRFADDSFNQQEMNPEKNEVETTPTNTAESTPMSANPPSNPQASQKETPEEKVRVHDKKLLHLQSSDGISFSVPVEITRISTTLYDMVENLGLDDEVVILPIIEGNILSRIIEWAERYEFDPVLIENLRDVRPLSNWNDREFVNYEATTLLQLCKAADYLDIKGLYDVTSKAMSKHLDGKNFDEVMEILERSKWEAFQESKPRIL
ncbi:S-phase kinase-associated protein 1-like isoform X1 [Harmonia axyridis]|uniref:S-phase kinase-associated protein 1-like isoform X1 n=1 Tax=Harmonia axyridis TaxID=115357 RepID=UPI001E275723|nr:S-phase kinase-associated protein 1-like isoform X1 [Harmonia axyridis]